MDAGFVRSCGEAFALVGGPLRCFTPDPSRGVTCADFTPCFVCNCGVSCRSGHLSVYATGGDNGCDFDALAYYQRDAGP